MCTNSSCPSKEKCYRWVATPNERWQSYSSFSGPEEGKDCSGFLKISTRDEKNLNFSETHVIIKPNQ